MRVPLLDLAAALLFATGLAHTWLGERYLLIRLFRREDLPRLLGGTAFTKGTLRFAWHLTTVAWWGLGAVLLLAAHGAFTPAHALRIIGTTALVSALFPVAFTRGRHLSWVAFLAVGILALLAAGRG